MALHELWKTERAIRPTYPKEMTMLQDGKSLKTTVTTEMEDLMAKAVEQIQSGT